MRPSGGWERKVSLMRARWILLGGILLIASVLAVPAPARGQGYVGISGGLYEPEDDEQDNTEVFGLRGGYRFHPSFGFEGSLSQVDLLDQHVHPILDFGYDLQVDLYNLDLSLQWFPRGGHFVVFGGPGVARLDSEIDVITFFGLFSESDTKDIFTAHAGLGYDWQIGDRFFLRPEARARRYFDDKENEAVYREGLSVFYYATDYEAALTFGWRFGS
jgi:outer membrane protein with beta-barrel domain